MTATDNSWVLVTGASSGFGEEFARQYAEQGHSLVLVARRLDRLQTLAEALRQQYRIDVVVEQVDLSDIEAVIQLHQRLRERGIAIDILINNAGHGLQGPFVDGKLDAALAMLQLDVVSLTAVTHVFAQDMRARGRGKILLVASLLAYQGVENFAVYAAAKAYVLRLGEALHRELKRDGITVTALCPGMSDTGFAKAAQQKITPALKLLMMQPAPVVRAGIRALQGGRISVVPGWANKALVILTWATPRWLHQAISVSRHERMSRSRHALFRPGDEPDGNALAVLSRIMRVEWTWTSGSSVRVTSAASRASSSRARTSGVDCEFAWPCFASRAGGRHRRDRGNGGAGNLRADMVIIAVPEKSVWQLPRDILAATAAVVVDAGNYYPSRDSRIPEIDRGLPESAWVARLLGRPVIKAFNNILADSLATRGVPAGPPGRICLSVAGDDLSAKAKVQSLV